MDITKIGAIDIGSNAIRLLITNVWETDDGPVFKKNVLYRVPIRLGKDAFDDGIISEPTQNKLKHAVSAFKSLMAALDVHLHYGCATSAMREAENGLELINDIKNEIGVEINIISGSREAEIIYSTQISKEIDPEKKYLYVDVGGGSTEITLISNHEIQDSASFKIGTVRMLLDKVPASYWTEMKLWLESLIEKVDDKVDLIGSGGNITRLFKMSLKQKGDPITKSEIQLHHNYIKQFSVEDRIKLLDLKPDRADVIIPAAKIFLFIMDKTKASNVYVPKIGLADGITKLLYHKKIK